jgi:hypothetical protein
MVKPNEDPSINELLNRIVRLENRTARLQAQVADLMAASKVQVEAYKYQVDSTADHIIEIHDLLWPLVHRVFPGFAKAKKQIDAIVNLPPSSDPKSRPN